MLKFGNLVNGFILTTLTSGSLAWAGGDCSHCGGSGTCEEMVPVTCTEMKTVLETCSREEQQLKVVRVPKVIQVEQEVP